MSSPSPDESGSLTANIDLNIGDYRLQARMTVPSGPTSLRVMLPVIQGFADALVGVAVKAVEDKGKMISCKAGCGACCRQLVPISETEARQIADLVEAMPEPRRAAVRQRFADARRRLEATGMLDKLNRRDAWTDDEFREIGIGYFNLGIPCPFLEDESCSIHPERPVTCREYLVTSPAENCSHPTPNNIDWVPLAGKVWTALARFDDPPPGSRFIRWVPLVLAPEWASQHLDPRPLRPGPEWLNELFTKLTGKEVRGAAPPVGTGVMPEGMME
jgi:Fe-S-cluster containining protein